MATAFLLNRLLLNSLISGLVQLVLREKVPGNGSVELRCRLHLDVSEPCLAEHKIHKCNSFMTNVKGILCIKTFKYVFILHCLLSGLPDVLAASSD